jgi:hypothetical protein
VETVANFRIRRVGRGSAERLQRAATMGAAWGGYVRGERGMPPASCLTSAVWVVLRPSLASGVTTASIHDRRGSHSPATPGFWPLVFTPTLGSPDGVICRHAVFAVFGTMEEALTYLEAAGCNLISVEDYRIPRIP